MKAIYKKKKWSLHLLPLYHNNKQKDKVVAGARGTRSAAALISVQNKFKHASVNNYEFKVFRLDEWAALLT